MADDVVLLFHSDGRTQQMAADPATMDRAWMESQVGSATLEIVGCEEDDLTDLNYQPLFYLVANKYDDGLPRNHAVDAHCPETVRRVASHPSYDVPGERHTTGFSGPVLRIPRTLLRAAISKPGQNHQKQHPPPEEKS